MASNAVIFLSFFFKLCFAILYEGDVCELANGEAGKCVRLAQCPSAIELVRNRQHPETCSFIRTIPIVCCSLNSGPLSPRISEQKCQSYKMITATTTTTTTTTTVNPSDSNDSSHIFVVGGEESKPKEFPHMAALGFTNGNVKRWLCGGSLISEKFVLTAAHCLISKEYGAVQWVRLGDLDLSSSIDDAIPEDYQIIKRIPHPRYKFPEKYNDIALVELDRKIQISTYIKPACLPPNSNINLDVFLIATGWGLTQFQGKQSDILQKVALELFTEEECEETYKEMKNTRKLRNGILHEFMFCAGGRTEEKDTCQGDSGGPLQIRDGRSFIVIGITSFGKSCGIKNLPGVYTKVASYVPWIESIVWPNE